MTRPIIVIGHRPDGSLQAIYAGGDGAEAEAAFEAAGAPDFVRVEEVRFPPISRRRDFEVPILGTPESETTEVKTAGATNSPKVEESKPAKPPTKAELKKAEKAAREAAKAAEQTDEKAEF